MFSAFRRFFLITVNSYFNHSDCHNLGKKRKTGHAWDVKG